MKKIALYLLYIFFVIAFIFIFLLYKNPKVPVLCYHNLATADEKRNFPEESDWTIEVNNFREHLEYLKKHNYKTLTIDEFCKWKNGELKLPYKSVLITFDDGFLSNYKYAFPLLKEYNMNATVFVVGSFIENSVETDWTGNIKTYMSKDILNTVKNDFPNIDICSHSYNLHFQGGIQQDESILYDDLQTFNSFLPDTTVYCYPFGQFNEEMENALKLNNYDIAFRYGPNSNDYKKASKNDNNYEIPRLNVSHGMNVVKFGLRLLMYN